MGYREILVNMGADEVVLALFDGKIKMPKYTLKVPFDPAFGFPPAIIPICSSGAWPGYIGVAHHWFGSEIDSFVRYSSETDEILEIARDVCQLRAWLVFDFLCNVPNFDEVGDFSESIGFGDRAVVEEFFSDCAELSDLGTLDVFAVNTPAIISGFNGGIPSWVSSFELFDRFLDSRRIDLAWYSLSSPGWRPAEVVRRLAELAKIRSDSPFLDLVRTWNSFHS